MKTLIHTALFLCFSCNLSFASPDKLEQKIAIIKQAVDQTIASVKFADSKASKCTDNYEKNVFCPKTFSKGIKQEFTDPVLSSFSAHKSVVEKELSLLPAILKKPVDEKGLKQVDACSEGENVLKKDFQTRLDALNKGKLALKKITDGSGGLGTKGWYSKLHNLNSTEAAKFQKLSRACVVEAKYERYADKAPKSPHELFMGAFERDILHLGCDSNAIKHYMNVGDKEKGTFKKINDAADEINSVLDIHIKKLEEQIALSTKRQDACPTAKDKKKEEVKGDEEKKPEEKKEEVKEPEVKQEEKKPDTTKVDEKKSTISGDSDNCEASAYTPYGNDGTKNSCYKAAGTAKERSKNLATLRKENPEALEKALIDRDTPEAKALSKQLLDEADAYAKAQNPPLPSPKVSARDSVCGESCVAYLKAKSAEQSGLDAQTVSYLKKKASTTQRRKLQDVSY